MAGVEASTAFQFWDRTVLPLRAATREEWETMKRFQQGLFVSLGALALAAGTTGCNEAKASQDVAVVEQPLLDDIAKQCGLACPGDKDDKGVEIKGIAEGNAAISGVASVDAFFASVVNFQGAATGVSGGINAQLDAIRADFGIAGDVDLDVGIKAAIVANVDGSLTIDAEPAKCQADVQATLEASARCDASVDPGKAMVECKGSCTAEASAEASCDANADVVCTFTPPDLKCEGGCQGTCSAKLEAAASCSGTCKGSCSGNCSAYVKNAEGQAECSGSCQGECTGSCETELAAEASCEGECKGQCTLKNPTGGCMANASVKCEAKANASVMCDGKCEGEFEPPMAKAECQASAKADAKVNVQCTPPRVAVSYKLRAVATADLAAQAKFEAALKTFASVRLPALLAEVKRAGIVVDAGAGLVTSATGLVDGFADAALDADLSVKAKFGLTCAAAELPNVEGIITKSSASLKASIEAAGKLTAAVGV
jgi:hypothetical protein